MGALVELDGENEEVGKNVAQHIAAMSPLYLSREDVPEDVVANERRIAEETSREEGKPEQALPKIVEGRVNGFFKDVCLLEQPWVRDNKKTIGAYLNENGDRDSVRALQGRPGLTRCSVGSRHLQQAGIVSF